MGRLTSNKYSFFVLILIEIRIQEFLTEFLPPPDGDNNKKFDGSTALIAVSVCTFLSFTIYSALVAVWYRVPELQRSRVMILTCTWRKCRLRSRAHTSYIPNRLMQINNAKPLCAKLRSHRNKWKRYNIFSRIKLSAKHHLENKNIVYTNIC